MSGRVADRVLITLKFLFDSECFERELDFILAMRRRRKLRLKKR